MWEMSRRIGSSTLTVIILLMLMTPFIYADQVPRDFYAEISKGNIPGHGRIHIFGQNPGIGTAWTDVWDNNTAYAFLMAASTLNVSSTDVNDDAAPPSTGAWNITILGLGANYGLLNETVQLNGRTAVATTNSYIRIYRLIVNESGTTGTNEGKIFVGTGAVDGSGYVANPLAEIPIGMGQTLMAIYTVPANKTAFMTIFYTVSDETKAVQFALFQRPYGDSWNVKERIHLYQMVWSHEYIPPRPITERTDIAVCARVGSGTAAASAGFCLFLVNDNVLGNSTLAWDDGELSEIAVGADPTPIFAGIAITVALVLVVVTLQRRR